MRFPRISHLSWECPEARRDAALFAKYLKKGLWPHLKSTSLRETNISDESLSEILRSIKQITRLYARGMGLGPRSLKELEPVLKLSLRILDIWNCSGMDEDLTGRTTQRILEACNNLREFKCGKVSAHVFLKGGPWTSCAKSLTVLRICFNFAPRGPTGSNAEGVSTLDQVAINGAEGMKAIDHVDLQKFIFERLSMLSKLQHVDFGDGRPSVHGLDFRLNHGMEQPVALKRIIRIRLKNTVQRMSEEEQEWILEHWNILKSFHARMNEYKELHTKFSGILAIREVRVPHYD